RTWRKTKYTDQVFNSDAHILEINSKTGLYPLYAALSIYYQEYMDMIEQSGGKFSFEDQLMIWQRVLRENIFVVAKTPMARAITQRTLAGYLDMDTNIAFVNHIVEDAKASPKDEAEKIKRKFGNMKFDVVIGNPPYQDSATGDNDNYAAPIYSDFMNLAYRLSDLVTLITPARFLFNAGGTSKQWNQKMLNDPHFKVVMYEANSSAIFPRTDIKGGIAISLRDMNQKFEPIEIFTAFPELNSILKKVLPKLKGSLSEIISGRGVYKLSDKALSDHPEIEKLQSKGHKKDVGSGAFKVLKNIVFFESKPNDGHDDYVRFLGLANRKREFWWGRQIYQDVPDSFYHYKIFIPQANGNGSLGEVLSTPLIADPLIGATETFLSIGDFSTEKEAESCMKYIKSKFARAMLGILKTTQANTRSKWQYVPLQDFTLNSDINWTKSISEIDQQLYKKYGLSDEEIKFIETKVQVMD
ncbi:Eco57I restriction-modification methylase domain-containing protein, partial [Lactobacillus amylovorus]